MPSSPSTDPNNINDDTEAFEEGAKSKLAEFKDIWLATVTAKEDVVQKKTKLYRKLSQLDKQQYRAATMSMRNDLDRMLKWMDIIDGECEDGKPSAQS
jgi:hypothetical protein